MIARITGKVIEREEKAFIVDVGGVGYRVLVGSALRERVRKGSQVSLRIHHHITDSSQELYGFQDGKEQECFELLMTVPSIGARLARNVLNTVSPGTLEQAIVTEDLTLLTKVSGVGRRTAERIITELKEKIQSMSIRPGISGTIQYETIEALVSLGFSLTQAREKVRSLPQTVKSVEEAVKAVLKHPV